MYVTESMRLTGEGKYITEKWRDMVHPNPEMDAGAIVSEVIEKCGLKVIE